MTQMPGEFILILLCTALIVLCITCIHFANLWRNAKKKNTLQETILDAVSGGYIHIDLVGKGENSSPAISHMFNLTPNQTNLKAILQQFGDHREELQHFIHHLKSGNQSQFQKTFWLEIAKKSVCFRVSGFRIEDRESFTIGIILWFYDITNYVSKIESSTTLHGELSSHIRSLNHMMDSLPLPVWQYDNDMNLVFTNERYDSLTSHKDHREDLDPDIKKHAQQSFEQGRPLKLKKHLVREGKRRFLSVHHLPISQNTILGYAEDITEQESMEKELKSHISAHSDLLESSSSAMAVYGRDTKLRFYNNAFASLWNLDERFLNKQPTYTEVIEQLRNDRKLPEQANFQKFREEQLALFSDLIQPHNDFFYLPDGTSLRVIVIPHALGGLLFAYEDMTDHLAMESSYNTLIAVQKETIDNLNEGVLVIGENGLIKLYNPTYAKMWPATSHIIDKNPHYSELLECSKSLFKVKGDWNSYKQSILNNINDRKPHSDIIERTDRRTITRSYVPLPDGATFVSFVDITDSKLVEQSLRERTKALEEADRLKTEFLANISYELRTPLTSIMGFSESLLAQYLGELNDRQHGYVENIHSSSQHLMSLINDILDLASIEAGYLTLDIRPFDIEDATYAMINLLTRRARDLGITIHFDYDQTLPKMTGDERRFKQVVFNLLSNAVKFTQEGGHVEIVAKRYRKNQICVSFIDNGIGMSDDEVEKMFDKFYRTQQAINENKSGTGLGLSMVKRIIEMHDGRIEVKSSKGKGTTMRCYFKLDGPSSKTIEKWSNKTS